MHAVVDRLCTLHMGAYSDRVYSSAVRWFILLKSQMYYTQKKATDVCASTLEWQELWFQCTQCLFRTYTRSKCAFGRSM